MVLEFHDRASPYVSFDLCQSDSFRTDLLN